MKISSPLHVLFLLHQTTSLPIPSKTSTSQLIPTDCLNNTYNLRPTIHCLLSLLGNLKTPATKLTTPHFPPHQGSYPTPEEEDAFDNSPYTPSADTPVSVALSSSRPLESAYLRSLSSSSCTQQVLEQGSATIKSEEEINTTDPSPAEPTSALPSLRKEDLHRYWVSKKRKLHASSLLAWIPKSKSKSQKGCAGGRSGNMLLPGEIYIKSQNMAQRSDIVVVGIVVLFLMIVVLVEGAEKLGDLKTHILKLKGKKCTRANRGDIYLPTHSPSHQSPLSIQASSSIENEKVESFP